MTELIAPPHICGRLPLSGSARAPLSAARQEWIVSAYAAGHRQRAIATALRISNQRVSAELARANAPHPPRRCRPASDRAHYYGIRVGYMGAVYDAMPDAMRDHLDAIAAKRSVTVAQAMADELVRLMGVRT